jgi:hypothetical protein
MALMAELPPYHREIIREQYVLAVDLGQSSDPTSIAVLHHKNYRHMHPKGSVKEAGDTFDVRYLKRLPLGLSYMEQVGAVAHVLARPPLREGCELVIDETGVGRPVGDLFDNTGMRPTRVAITAGDNQTCAGPHRWHVAKSLLISGLDARLHTGELRFAAELTEAGAMAEELKDFRRKVSAAGRYTFEARVGRHDDLVLAVAIGLWAIVGRPKTPPVTFGTWSSTAPSLHTYERN